MRIEPAQRLTGTLNPPGDKSISHRYALLAALARGRSCIRNYSRSRDCCSTLDCLYQLGVSCHQEANQVTIESGGFARWKPASETLYAGNSGTTLRLLAGPLAGSGFESAIAGDRSLNRRPMKRIIEPLVQMGAEIRARRDRYPPLEINGCRLRGLSYRPRVASAQVKSCVLLAGLTATGSTRVEEIRQTRDHSERAFPHFGARVQRRGLAVSVAGGQNLHSANLAVPGDFSAAAFFMVASLLLPGSKLSIPQLGVNPTRIGLLRLLQQAGLILPRKGGLNSGGEPVADLEISYQNRLSENLPPTVQGDWIPNLIDEIPILAVLACGRSKGFCVRQAKELRHKESDRIHSIVYNLKNLGVQVKEFEDGFRISPGQRIQGGRVSTFGDHRIAMAFAIAGLVSKDGVELDDGACATVSFPGFFETLESLCDR